MKTKQNHQKRHLEKELEEELLREIGRKAMEENRGRFELILVGLGENEDKVTEAICDITGIDPRLARYIASDEDWPSVLSGVSEEKAIDGMLRLEEAGAEVVVGGDSDHGYSVSYRTGDDDWRLC